MEEKETVFMCLDVEKRSIVKYQTGVDLKAVLWIGLTSLALFLLFAFTFTIQQALLKTDNIYIVFALDLFIYLLIEQKLVRIFVFHEKEMMDMFIQQKLSTNINLAPYYDVRPDGFELCKHKGLGLFDKCLYNNGKESIFINLYMGSKYSRGPDTKDLNAYTYTQANNYIRRKGYRIVKSTYREPNINSAMFKYYDEQIIKEDETYAQDFAKVINHFKEKQPKVFMTTVQIIAITPEQKLSLIEDCLTYVQILSQATYREIRVLKQNDILTFFKTEYGLNVLDLNSILVDTDKKVPLGISKILAVCDNGMNVLKTYAKQSIAAMLGDDVMAFRKTNFQEKKQKAKTKQEQMQTEEEKLTLG